MSDTNIAVRQTCRASSPDDATDTPEAMRDEPDALSRFLRHRLTQPLPGLAAHQRLAPPHRTDWHTPETPAARRAAALLLLYPTASAGLTTALTVRQSGLPHHADQVSLPGGSLLAGETPQDAALREAHEEIGLPMNASEIIGALSPVWIPVSNFLLLPFVALASARPSFVPDTREVAAVLETPIHWLRDPRALTWTTFEHLGRETRCPGFDVHGHVVWGATAMVLAEFAALWDGRDVAASSASSDGSGGLP